MPNTDIDNISKEVKNNGYALKKEWLNYQDQTNLSKFILKLKPKKRSKESIACSNLKDYIFSGLKFNFKKIKISLVLNRIAKKLQLQNIAEKILDKKTKLIRIDFYHNEISNDPVLDWHCDNAYSGKKDVNFFLHPDDFAIKFFFYLTDVFPGNGCLSYIKKSNQVTYALRKGIYEGKIDYSPYWKLEDLKKKILEKKNLNYIKNFVSDGDLNTFFNSSEYILKDKNNAEGFDFSMKKGGAIIFNESGVHRGSATKFSERISLRFFYKKV